MKEKIVENVLEEMTRRNLNYRQAIELAVEETAKAIIRDLKRVAPNWFYIKRIEKK